MKKSRKPAAADDDDSCYSPFNCLPDEAVLEILKKLIDLKTLCVCEVVSKRFYAIVHQVDTICYTTTQDPFSLELLNYELFVLKSMKKFSRVKSLCIQFPSTCPHEQQQQGVNNNNNNNYDGVLFKWKVKLGKNSIDSCVFVSPTSIYDKNNNDGLVLLYGEEKEEEDNAELPFKLPIALDCFLDVAVRFKMLIYGAICLPLLEKASCTDLGNRGRVFFNGRVEIERIISQAATNELFKEACRYRVSEYYLPLLELPVSGYVMKGVTLVVMDWNDVPDDATYDSFINDDIDFKHDKQEAAYHEAITEFCKKRKLGVSIVRLG